MIRTSSEEMLLVIGGDHFSQKKVEDFPQSVMGIFVLVSHIVSREYLKLLMNVRMCMRKKSLMLAWSWKPGDELNESHNIMGSFRGFELKNLPNLKEKFSHGKTGYKFEILRKTSKLWGNVTQQIYEKIIFQEYFTLFRTLFFYSYKCNFSFSSKNFIFN